ncbi:hypothetical protein [Streptomyces rubiginosohelvolus]|uniref:hypothetical protein n=1 Tax=Streptomyces rubiginosohelvolus TaxID=67362 RepID=UPI00365268A8
MRDLWEQESDLRRHAYGTTRPMYLDGWRPRPAWVRIITGEPASNTQQPGRRAS